MPPSVQSNFRRVWPLTLALAVLVSGCLSIEPPRFHSLLPSVDEPMRSVEGGPLYFDLGPVGVPTSVDQPQWLVRMADDSMRMLEKQRWVGPLRDEIRSALAERLIRHWGALDLRTTPAPADTGWRVRVDVQRFESVAGREARMNSQWTATSLKNRSTVLSCRSGLREPAIGDLAALAAAHRRLVARLADQIGARLRALEEGRTSGCGGD